MAVLPTLFGDRSAAIFDLWSFQHFSSGVILGAILLSYLKQKRELIPIVLAAALFWEFVELTMEFGFFSQAVTVWKGGFEHWSNRFIGDPLMMVAGALLAKVFPGAWKVVIIPAAIWFLINILSPDSMHIQHWLFR